MTAMMCSWSIGTSGRQSQESVDRLIRIYSARDAVLEDHISMIKETRERIGRQIEDLEKMVQVSLDLYSESKKMLVEANDLSRENFNRIQKTVTHR